ncbi:MAG: hypothetical protein PVG22_10310 [Chromatiales bacterium]|jgi:hypothetical protein
MKRQSERHFTWGARALLAAQLLGTAGGLALPWTAEAQDSGVAALERRIDELTRQLEQARKELAAAQAEAKSSGETGAVTADQEVEPHTVVSDERAPAEETAPAEEQVAASSAPESSKIQFGPLTVGGAVRVNYILGSYVDTSDGPSRGGDGGNFELDTYRINLSLESGRVLGQLEYRWYNGYNFLHTGWLGYQIDEDSQIQAGVTRVPFGPGPYGVSQSWFFDQHYYVGLADDLDFGIKYLTRWGDWDLDFAYFYSSEGSWNGSSADSARYSYDAVKWDYALDPDGNVISAPLNGYSERNQFNLRAIYNLDDLIVPTELGVSVQYGQLKGKRADDGDHWAGSLHMVNQFGDFMLASQLTRYEIDIDDNNPWGTDSLIPMGAYDFAWPVATKAWIPAMSLSYRYDTPQLGWLDYVLPYLEYSSIIKDEESFNDSQMVILGAAWASGGWYIYSDWVHSNGNYFIGNEGDNYSNIYHGVGDFGVDGNDEWNYRFNINFGYYF